MNRSKLSPDRLISTPHGWLHHTLKFFCGYFVLSLMTLPMIGKVWWGELSPLAFIQLPKIALANWLRKDVVMAAMQMFGWSKGSFSPDYMAARSYSMVLAYAILFGIVAGLISFRAGTFPPFKKWGIISLSLATLDCLITLIFGDTRNLSLY